MLHVIIQRSEIKLPHRKLETLQKKNFVITAAANASLALKRYATRRAAGPRLDITMQNDVKRQWSRAELHYKNVLQLQVSNTHTVAHRVQYSL